MHKGQAACSSREEWGRVETIICWAYSSESQALAVIKNSPRAHCEVPSARTLCLIVNWGETAPLLLAPSSEPGKHRNWEEMKGPFCGTSCGNEATQHSCGWQLRTQFRSHCSAPGAPPSLAHPLAFQGPHTSE